ncbi:RimJ/RimL family protein N-acetyltransferase [Isoptericola jiangsuensis]|uniref:RimJ/RimL family protein N-acetyltransferase n=1 Tax=Isoptericola jiangsuensis TaxID=548579 RepID=A0A2A9EU54_9MICO|nr:GNAT family protein [Isoptericola jiangsuensis]PFG41820.1 RimJ/RimL family protein N-acetyltransferase [Isoptericola jiangsuensis]
MRHDLRLTAHGIRLEPLEHRHAADLLSMIDDDLWFGMVSPPPRTVADVEAVVDAAQAADGAYAFAVVGPDGELRGSTRFYEHVPAQCRVEIGYTFYGRAWWGGPTNPAAKLALLTHAFDVWQVHRVALRADARNVRSRAAIEKLGARAEGVLRKHRVAADGSVGDTAYYGIVDDEWPVVRAGLEARLARQER